MESKGIVASFIKIELREYFKVLENDGDLRHGAVADHDIDYLTKQIMLAIEAGEVECELRHHEESLEMASRNKPE